MSDSVFAELKALAGVEPTEAFSPHQGFTLRGTVIAYSQYSECLQSIIRIHEDYRNFGKTKSRLILGQSGAGKTTLLENYVSHFPRHRTSEGEVVPVLLVTLDASPTVVSVAQKILIRLGDPLYAKGSRQILTERIRFLFERCKVELILFDEFQHLVDSTSSSGVALILDWLKNLLNECRRPVIGAGLPRSKTVLGINQQLARRFGSPVEIVPFDIGTAKSMRQLQGVLDAFEKLLPIKTISLTDPSVTRRFYYASHGLIDYIVTLLESAVTNSKSGQSLLDLADYSAAFRRTFGNDVPEANNPFNPKAQLRHLERQYEPFELWDHSNDPKSRR